MESTVKAPDLLIYLRSSIPNLVGQIHKRGREYEPQFHRLFKSFERI
jgi:deoxyadenosine/deoxycytidine kinase